MRDLETGVGMGAGELQCFSKLILEVTYHHFCHILLATQTNFNSVL